MHEVLDKISAEAARHQLVPFFGAGASFEQLGIGWSEICSQMADEIQLPTGNRHNPLQIAEAYVSAVGQDHFIEFLRKRLIRETFDEAKGQTYLLILSMLANTIYTTNQDNIFELCAKKFGRPYRRVSVIDDLVEATPGEPLLVKFHGDLDHPESVVFTASSYHQRSENADHFLNIRLRADLLAKGFLFIGYSFQDPNIQLLFQGIRRVFGGRTPPSYLIAFRYDPAMDELTERYGVNIVDPMSHFPHAASNSEALELCMKQICDGIVWRRAQAGTEILFSEKGRYPSKICTSHELSVLAPVVDRGEFKSAIAAFRATLDQSFVSGALCKDVLTILGQLALKVTNTAESNQLHAALFNLKLADIRTCVEAVALVMASANRRVDAGHPDLFIVQSPQLPEAGGPSEAAMAVALLQRRGEKITDAFRRIAIRWFENWEDVEGAARKGIENAIRVAWANSGESPPFDYMRRVRGFQPLPEKSFHELMRERTDLLPQRFRNPEDQ